MRSGRSKSRTIRLTRLAVGGWLSLGAAWLAAGPPPARAADVVLVALDKAKLLRFPPATETIVLGNPIIADVTMLRSSGLLILTGKSFGETNLVLIDRAGNILQQLNLVVEPPAHLLTVQKGMDRESYSCNPRCQPAVSLGDATTFLGNAISGVQQRNGLATPAGPAGIAGPH